MHHTCVCVWRSTEEEAREKVDADPMHQKGLKTYTVRVHVGVCVCVCADMSDFSVCVIVCGRGVDEEVAFE